MSEAVLIGKITALELEKIAEYFRVNGLLSSPARSGTAIANQHMIYVRNDYAGTAPAYGCMQITGTVEVAGQNYFKVTRPIDATGAAGWYVFNGPDSIAQDEFGIAFDGPMVRMATDGSSVTAGTVWGPVANQWTIAPSGQLFVMAGLDDVQTNVAKGFFKGAGTSGATLFKATMKAPWSSGVASCDIYSIDGTTFTDTTIDANVYDGLGIFSTLTTGDSLLVLLQSAKYYAIQAPCP